MYVRYVMYVRSLRTLRTLHTSLNSCSLGYHSSSNGSTGSIMARAVTNSMASSSATLSSRNILFRASITRLSWRLGYTVGEVFSPVRVCSIGLGSLQGLLSL